MRPSSWFSKEQSPDLELGLEDLPRTSASASDGEMTPPLELSEPMPDWLKKELSRKRLSKCKLDQWAAAHDPKTDCGNKDETIHDNSKSDGIRSEVLPEHMMSGDL